MGSEWELARFLIACEEGASVREAVGRTRTYIERCLSSSVNEIGLWHRRERPMNIMKTTGQHIHGFILFIFSFYR